jgi:hypothetical protein
VGKFTLERISENGEVSFKANGEIDFFGEEAFTQLSGAGGSACTILPQAKFIVEVAA